MLEPQRQQLSRTVMTQIVLHHLLRAGSAADMCCVSGGDRRAVLAAGPVGERAPRPGEPTPGRLQSVGGGSPVQRVRARETCLHPPSTGATSQDSRYTCSQAAPIRTDDRRGADHTDHPLKVNPN